MVSQKELCLHGQGTGFLYNITSSLSSERFVLLIVKVANKPCEPITIFSIMQRPPFHMCKYVVQM